MFSQCVVAWSPSSTPAAARTNAPLQIDTTRRLRSRASARVSSTAAGRGRRLGSSPGTSTVSAARTSASPPSTATVRPPVVATWLVSPHTVSWYEVSGRGLKICAGMARARPLAQYACVTTLRRSIPVVRRMNSRHDWILRAWPARCAPSSCTDGGMESDSQPSIATPGLSPARSRDHCRHLSRRRRPPLRRVR